MAGSNVFPAIIRAQYDPEGAFASFAQDAQRASDGIKRQFQRDFDEIGNIARKALSIPRNAGGSLDLNAGEYREAAVNAKAYATALREVATAAGRAATSSGDTSAETRRYVQAANAAAIAAEKEARELNQQAQTYERLQTEINQTKSATDRLVIAQRVGISANGQLAKSNSVLRQASVQAGQQLQDIGISIYSGQRASVVFAQQLPQLAFALSNVGGRVGAIATFLSGPWGLAVGLGVGVLGTLISSLFETADAADGTKKATLSLSDALASSRVGTDAARKALADYNDEQDRARKSTDDMIKLNLAQAESDLKGAVALREKLAATLALADANAAANAGQGTGFAAGAFTGGQASRAQAALNENNSQISTLQQTIRNLRIQDAGRDAKAAADPIQRINDKFDDMAAAARRAAAGNEALSKSLKGTLTGYERQRKSALDAERDAQREGRGGGLSSDAPTYTQLRALIRREIPGARVTSTKRSFAEQKLLYERYLAGTGPLAAKPGTSAHEFGRAIDIAKGPGVTLESVRAALKRRGVNPSELLDEGRHIHVAVAEGRGALQDYADEARAASEAQKELSRELGDVLAKFDPATRAAAEFAETLAKIDKLKSAGLIGAGKAFTYEAQAIADERRRIDKAANDNADDFYAKLGLNPIKELKQLIEGFGDLREAQEQAAAEKFIESVGTGLDGIASIFGGNVARFLDGLSRGAAANKGINPLLNGISIGAKDFRDALRNGFNDLFNKVFGGNGPFAKTLGRALAGAQTGQASGDIFTSITGAKTSRTGSAIGGALGEAVGKKLFSKLGSFAGPLGSIAGGIVGGLVGGLFKKTPKASTSITSANGSFNVSGNDANSKAGVSGIGNSIQGGLQTIVDALGGTLGDFGVSVGQRKDYFRVSGSANANVTSKHPGGLLYDGTDAAEAARVAILNAIQDGALKGISRGAQALLSAGKNLDTQLQKALKFDSVAVRLKQYTDPVGAALDALDKEFTSLKSIFSEAGASAAEYADLEKLYGIERAKAIEESTKAVSGSLRELYKDLTVGDNGRSLRDRFAEERKLYDPLVTRVKAGDITAFDDFSTVGREMLDLIRQISGSTPEYFRFLDELTGVTKGALDSQSGAAGASAIRPGLFDRPSNANTPVVDALGSLQSSLLGAWSAQLNAVNDNLGTLIRLAGSGPGGIGQQFFRNNF